MVKGAVEQVWLPQAQALVDAGRRAGPRAQGRAAARAHPRPAGDADDDGQGARRPRAPPRRQLRAHRAAGVPRQVQRRHRHLRRARARRCPTSTGPRCRRAFVEGLGLTWNPLTTQIESHDWQAELYADVARFNRILHNLCTDVWTYISLGLLRAGARPGHGRARDDAAQGQPDPLRERRGQPRGVATRCSTCSAATLVQSRLQRDLTDSLDAAQHRHGVRPLAARPRQRRARARRASTPCPSAWRADLEANWEVLGEPIQSAMRALGAQGVPGSSGTNCASVYGGWSRSPREGIGGGTPITSDEASPGGRCIGLEGTAARLIAHYRVVDAGRAVETGV